MPSLRSANRELTLVWGKKSTLIKTRQKFHRAPVKTMKKKKMKTKLDEKNIPMVIHDYVIKKFKLMR